MGPSPPSSAGGRHLKHPRAWLLAILGLVLTAFAPSLRNGFTFDDADVVRVPSRRGSPNLPIADLQPLHTYYTQSYTAGHGGAGRGLRPTLTLSLALIHAISERPATGPLAPAPGEPAAPAWPQHLVNVALHCCATWLMFELLALFVGAGIPALCGAAVFGLHAVRSQPVIALVGRGEVMAFVFGCGGTLLFVHAMRRIGIARLWRLLVAIPVFFAAFGSKENALPWLIMTPVVAWCVLRRRPVASATPSPARLALAWLFCVALPAAVFLLLLRNLWSAGHEFVPLYETNPLWFVSATERAVNGVILLAYSLAKILVPWHLNHDYGHRVFDLAVGLGDWRFWLSLLMLAVVLVAGLRSMRRHPLLFLGVAFFFGFALPTSNILVPLEAIYGERHLYTPAVISSCLVASIAGHVSGWRRNLAAAILVLWCTVGSLLIVGRCFDWHDGQALFAADARTHPNCIRLQLAVGDALHQHPDQQRQAYLRAHALDPASPRPLLALSKFFLAHGDPRQAEHYARLGFVSKHHDAIAKQADFRIAAAKAATARGDSSTAESLYRDAVKIAEATSPLSGGDKRLLYAMFLLQSAQTDQALAQLHEITRRAPQFVPAWLQLLSMAERRGDDAEARRLLRTCQQRFGNLGAFTAFHAAAELRRGQRAAAIRIFEQVMPRLPRDQHTALPWLRFARLLGESGRIDAGREITAWFLTNSMTGADHTGFVDLGRRLGIHR